MIHQTRLKVREITLGQGFFSPDSSPSTQAIFDPVVYGSSGVLAIAAFAALFGKLVSGRAILAGFYLLLYGAVTLHWLLSAATPDSVVTPGAGLYVLNTGIALCLVGVATAGLGFSILLAGAQVFFGSGTEKLNWRDPSTWAPAQQFAYYGAGIAVIILLAVAIWPKRKM